MKNKTMIIVYRICFILLLLVFLMTSALGFANDMMFKISILLGFICVLTFILLLFEILEDYFNKQIDLIVKDLNKSEEAKENGSINNETRELHELENKSS